MDFTGTGNSLNPVHPSGPAPDHGLAALLGRECHVDGFRFDLASALAREFYDVDRLSAFFDIIHQDPLLSQVKLIAEPWDVGPGGYQVGNFPVLWSEWNGMYRDTVRDFWRGQRRLGVRVALRRLGRSLRGRRQAAVRVDQLRHRARRLHAARPRLVQREAQRGERRGQPGRHRRQPLVELRRRRADRRPASERAARAPAAQLPHDAAALPGRSDAARRRRARSRTQDGNNNAWCQDNEISWFDWDLDDDERRLLEFARRVIFLRRDHPVFRRSRFFAGSGADLPDVWWMRPDGRKMTQRDWKNDGGARDRRLPQRRRAQRDDGRAARRYRTSRSSCSSTPITSR